MANNDFFRVVVAATLNNRTRYFDLDLCKERNVNTSMTITQYPVQSGVVVSDHMYRNPTTISIGGTFSLNHGHAGGSVGEDFYTSDALNKWAGSANLTDFFGENSGLEGLSNENRLYRIQTIFDYIQRNGLFCKVMMIDDNLANSQADEHNDKVSTRFKSYNNMVLRDISWVEKQNSMDFRFTFQEVITAANLIESFDWFTYGNKYPSPMLPASKTLGELMQGSDDIITFVLKTLLDYGYIDKADFKLFAEVIKNGKGIGGDLEAFNPAVNEFLAAFGTAAILSPLSTVGTIAAAAAINEGNNVLGWILAVVAGACSGIFGTIASVVAVQKAVAVTKLSTGFNLIKNYTQFIDPNTLELKTQNLGSCEYNQADLVRLQYLLEYIKNEIVNALSCVKVYQITMDPNDNIDRELALTLGTETLVTQITKLDGDREFKMTLFDLDGNIRPSWSGPWPVQTDLNACNRNENAVYVTRDMNYEVYLFSPIKTTKTQTIAGGRSYTYTTNIKRNLSDYYLIASYGKLEDNMKKINDTIIKALKNQGFTE